MLAPRALLFALAVSLPCSWSLAANPTSVTIAGSLQSEAGCSGDWDPTCAVTHLGYDAGSDVWRATFVLPAGNYEYKAALNDSWDENYGANGGGANIPLSVPAGGASVRFYYDHKTHWVTSNRNTVIATVPGSFQSALGCASDWDPACLRTWLEDVAGTGAYSFTATLPEGSFECKVAIDESWAENYGAGGASGGANIAFTVPAGGGPVVFSYDAVTHVLIVCPGVPTVTAPAAAQVTQTACE